MEYEKEHTKVVGRSIKAVCDSDLAKLVYDIGSKVKETSKIVMSQPFFASEDVTYMMEEVQKNGGKAGLSIVWNQLAVGHHHPAFDLNEKTITVAVEVYRKLILYI